MELLKLLIVFLLIIGLVMAKKPMLVSLFAGSIASWLLFGISVKDGATLIVTSIIAKDTIQIILVMYVITLLQKMMDKRNVINLVKDGLSNLFHSRWVNCIVAPFFIGMLPTPNSAFFAGDMVKASASEYLDDAEMATAATYFRHISESFVPTYQQILIALALTGLTAGEFVLGMLPLVCVAVVLGILFFLKGKVPNKIEGASASKNKSEDLKKIAQIWPIILAIVLIVAFNINALIAGCIVVVIYFVTGHFSFKDIAPLLRSSLNLQMVWLTFAVFTLRSFLSATGTIELLPDFFAQFPLPTFLIYVIIFFLGTLAASATTMTVSILPLAMATVPNAGLPLVCLLSFTGYMAMELSPTHICIMITADYFGVTYGDIVKRLSPLVAVFMVIAVLYYLGWTMFL